MRWLALLVALLAFPALADDSNVSALRPLTTHVLWSNATSARVTDGLHAQTQWVRIYAAQDAHVAFGGSSVTASATDTTTPGTASDMYVPAGTIEYFWTGGGGSIAVIRDSLDGEVYITEMTR